MHENLGQVEIAKIQVRDPSEIRKLARLVTELVYSVVISYVGNHQDAEEIIQDTLLKTIESIGQFENNSSLKTWIYRIAINNSKDVLKYRTRKKRAGQVISIDSGHQSDFKLGLNSYFHPGEALESKEQVNILFRGINQLPEGQKQALTLMKLENLSMKEVASIMETTPKAVEGLISRSKVNLKAFLETDGITLYKQITNGK